MRAAAKHLAACGEPWGTVGNRGEPWSDDDPLL